MQVLNLSSCIQMIEAFVQLQINDWARVCLLDILQRVLSLELHCIVSTPSMSHAAGVQGELLCYQSEEKIVESENLTFPHPWILCQ